MAFYRVCPGRLFGEAAIFLAVSNVVATLDISKSRDSLGREITPEVSFLSGFVRSVGTSNESEGKAHV